MHTLQKLLITRLLEKNGLKYSELTRGYDSDDDVVFHVKQLTNGRLMDKREDRYYLTSRGIQALGTFQKTDLADNNFKMTFVGLVCQFEDEYLIKPHPDAKQPFYNLPSGSPLFGESLDKALPRILYEETELDVKFNRFTFDSLHMKTVVSKNDKVLFDDAFVVYKIDIKQKEKEKMEFNKGSKWMSIESIKDLDNTWPEIDYCVLRKKWEVYKNYTIVSDYNLR